MVCFNPVPAVYNTMEYAKTGKKHLILVVHQDTEEKRQMTRTMYPSPLFKLIHVPCGKCAGCRSDHAKMWALRAYNEMQMHDRSCFITLTYNEDNPLVASDPLCLFSLRYKHFQDFMKRLRKKLNYPNLQYLVCGEYGTESGRSHWHAILFGVDFSEIPGDKEFVYESKGYKHYRSTILEESWSVYNKEFKTYIPIGFVDLADCDIDCCNYVAGYVLKKLPSITSNPEVFDNVELIDRCPTLIRSSRRPAIGYKWYEKYGKNACEKGFQYVPFKNGNSCFKAKTPAYYYSKFEIDEPELHAIVKKRKDERAELESLKNPVNYEELARRELTWLHRISRAIKLKLDKL